VGEVSTGGKYGTLTPTLTLPRQGGGDIVVKLAGDQCYSDMFLNFLAALRLCAGNCRFKDYISKNAQGMW